MSDSTYHFVPAVAMDESNTTQNPLPSDENFQHGTAEYDTVQEQLGGGRRCPSPPPIETPTRLRSTIKMTERYSGLVHEAQARRSMLLPQLPIPSESSGPDPFLAEPLIQGISLTGNVPDAPRGQPKPKGLCLPLYIPSLDLHETLGDRDPLPILSQPPQLTSVGTESSDSTETSKERAPTSHNRSSHALPIPPHSSTASASEHDSSHLEASREGVDVSDETPRATLADPHHMGCDSVKPKGTRFSVYVYSFLWLTQKQVVMTHCPFFPILLISLLWILRAPTPGKLTRARLQYAMIPHPAHFHLHTPVLHLSPIAASLWVPLLRE
jgi:hypothetical protein